MKPCDSRQAKEYEVRYGEEEKEADLEDVQHPVQHLATCSHYFTSENSFATEAVVASVARNTISSKRNEWVIMCITITMAVCTL